MTPLIRHKIKNLIETMHRDYLHSSLKPPSGEKITKKLLAGMDSLHVPLTDNQGNATTLRSYLMSMRDRETNNQNLVLFIRRQRMVTKAFATQSLRRIDLVTRFERQK